MVRSLEFGSGEKSKWFSSFILCSVCRRNLVVFKYVWFVGVFGCFWMGVELGV